MGKPGFSVATGASTQLNFQNLKPNRGYYTLRLTAALDFREEKEIEVRLGTDGQKLGVFNIRYAHPFQPFDLSIDAKWIPAIRQQGLSLVQTKGTVDAWFFAAEPDMDALDGLQPQLLFSKQRTGTETDFLTNLHSLNVISPFGWLGGCGMDGLYELYRAGDKSALSALQKLLSLFLSDEKGIIYENPQTIPIDGTFNSIEDFLPFACIADLFPTHPSILKATDFLLARKNNNGLIVSGNDVTTEGCYTVAYPLAVIAKRTNNKQLAQIAVDQLTHRMRLLTSERAIYQRSTLAGVQTFQNWGRGVAWYLLGTIKTLNILHETPFGELAGVDALRQSFQTCVGWIVPLQDKNGLWFSYLDQPETGIDTSATAGIASAIGWGCSLNLLPATLLTNARRAYTGLGEYITTDGFLTHVSQINRGGEALQKSGYRVISQFGMGLMGQLKAVLDKN